jgi:hypothetical protein
MVGFNSCFTIHSTIAEEHGAQQACNSTLPSSLSRSPSGKTIAGLFILVAKLQKKVDFEKQLWRINAE